MIKLKDWIWGAIIAISFFFLGWLSRQPSINKLKKQVITLQKNNEQLLARCDQLQTEFRELLVQHKALKVLQIKRKAESKGRLQENLMMQYAIRDYLELLLNRIKTQQKLSRDEKAFFKAFEGVIDGAVLTGSDKAHVKEYVVAHHKKELDTLRECDFAPTLQALSGCSC